VTAGPGLRSAVTGLLGLAATEERMLLAQAPAGESGTPRCWAALPVLAHNAEFKDQQVQRLRAIGRGDTPPDFPEIDHGSAEVYRGYAALSAAEVTARSSQVSAELIDGLGSLSDEDLTDPSRHPWLRGRQLWLQVVVRGFWHPMGHLGDYYLAHSQGDRAVALAMHAVATAGYLGAPDPARGMAGYTLACAQAQVGQPDQAAATLCEAIRLNPDLRANAGRDPDLAVVRDRGLLQDLPVTG
jgi:DinB superfamily